MLAHDLAQLVEVRVEGILLAVHQHPFGHQRAASADDAGQASLGQGQVLAEQPAVDRHVVHSLTRLQRHNVQKILRPHVGDVVELLGHLVNGDRAQGDLGRLDDPLAHGIDVGAGRQVHHRVGPVADRQAEFFHLALRIAGDGRLADIGVDLGPRGDADADWY